MPKGRGEGWTLRSQHRVFAVGFRAVSVSTNIYPFHAFITHFPPSSTAWRRLAFLVMDGNPTLVSERREQGGDLMQGIRSASSQAPGSI